MQLFDLVVNPEAFEKWMVEEAEAGRGKLIIIDHQPYSKANSRRPATFRSKAGKKYTTFIKSENAMSFVDVANHTKLCYGDKTPYTEDVVVFALLRYRSRRSDVDESLVLDSLQGKCYANDRQVRSKVIIGKVDKDRQGATVFVRPYYSEESKAQAVSAKAGRAPRAPKSRQRTKPEDSE